MLYISILSKKSFSINLSKYYRKIVCFYVYVCAKTVAYLLPLVVLYAQFLMVTVTVIVIAIALAIVIVNTFSFFSLFQECVRCLICTMFTAYRDANMGLYIP